MSELAVMSQTGIARLPTIDVERVVVMDDDTVTRRVIREIIAGFGGTAFEATSEGEVLHLAEKFGIRNFVLDIHMGDDRNSEGLDTLERIKNMDPNAFVGMLSNHADLFREMAERLECDVFREKTTNRADDIRFILRRLLEVRQSNIEDAKKKFSAPPIGPGQPPHGPAGSEDINVRSLSALFGNPDWMARNRNMYVMLVEGRVVGVGRDKVALIKGARERFPDRNRMIEFISAEEPVVEVWSPLAIS